VVDVGVGLQDADRPFDRALRVALGVLEGALEEDHALGKLGREVFVEVGGHFAAQLVVPGGPAVRPRLDGPLPGAGRLDGELTRPAHAGHVGVDGVQFRLQPSPSAWRLVLDDSLQLLVAVAEYVGGNGDRVAYGALDGVPAVVEDRRRLCDPDPARAFTALRCGHLSRQ